LSTSFGLFQNANLFAGGVLLAVSLLHLLPDAVQALGGNLPAAVALYILGYAIIYIVDKLLVSHDTPHTSTSQLTTKDEENNVSFIQEETSSLILTYNQKHYHYTATDDDSSSADCSSCQNGNGNQPPASQHQDDVLTLSPSSSSSSAMAVSLPSASSAWSLWISLAVHSVLEGASLGATFASPTTSTTTPTTNDLAVGLFLHKCLVASAVSLTWKSFSPWFFGTFCLMSPIGMMVGWYLVEYSGGGSSSSSSPTGTNFVNDSDNNQSDDDDTELLPGIVAGISGGTFLFVSIHEMLLPAWRKRKVMTVSFDDTTSAEQNHHQQRCFYWKLVLPIMVGFSLIAIWTG
jgi:zinc transporter ZupT